MPLKSHPLAKIICLTDIVYNWDSTQLGLHLFKKNNKQFNGFGVKMFSQYLKIVL